MELSLYSFTGQKVPTDTLGELRTGLSQIRDPGSITMQGLLTKFVRDESGATAIEYALIAAGIGIAILTAVNALGTVISDKFNTIATTLK